MCSLISAVPTEEHATACMVIESWFFYLAG